MTERNKFLSYAIEHRFPHPIAAPFRCAQTSQSDADRASFYLATVDGFLRYVGSILIADFFTKGPSKEMAGGVMQVLLQPLMTKWTELVLELASQLSSRKPFMPELTRALVHKPGKPTPTGTALRALANRAEQLLEVRTNLLDGEQGRIVAGELEEQLLDLLAGFPFLEEYPLVYFRRHAAASGNGFRGFMLRWMGHRSHPLPVGVEFEGPVPEESPLVVSPETKRGLELAPFLTVVGDRETHAESLYVVSGLRTPGWLKSECFMAGRFLTRPLTNAQDESVPLTEYMETWAEGGRVASLAPSKASEKRLQFKSRLLPAEKVLEGRYKALGFIGRGGIGAVYRVYDLEEQVDKAVKILYPDLSRNEFFTRYFIQTGTALSKLESDHLVPVYEAGYSSTLQENHILTAHMKGGSLAELMERRETLPPREALRVAIGILAGLEAVHKGGLVHGGIHPGNILFDSDGKPCLADFGILRLPSSRVTTFRPLERLHSLQYASPELLLGGQASTASDIYSLGQVLYEMVTGRIPSKTEYVPPSELIFPVPEELDRVLQQALAPAPEQRYRSATELGSALEKIRDEMGPEYQVSPTAQAQQLLGHLADVHSGHAEALDQERAEKLEAGDYEGAARLLQLKIDELWDIDERVFWMQELAALHFEKLDKPGKAVSIYRDCVEMAPDNPRAVAALVDHFEKTEQWEELSGLLRELVDETESDEQMAGYLERLVTLHHERLGDVAGASDFLEKLVVKTGAKDEWIELLVRLKEEARDWAGAARALEKWLEGATETEQTVGILRRLGAIYHQELEDTDAAIHTYERLVKLGGADAESMMALRHLYRRNFAYAALARLLRQLIQAPSLAAEEQLEMYQELGEILSSYLYESKEAIRVWNELLQLDERNHTALSYLERIYLREGETEAYLEVLDRKAAVTEDGEEKAAILLSSAMARLESDGEVEEIRRLLEEALRLAPGHRGIEAALERLYAEHGDNESRSRLLLLRLDREEEPAVRLETLRKLAELFEKEGDLAATFQVLQRTLTETPLDPVVRKELERVAQEEGDIEGLVTFYMEALPDAAPDQALYLAARVAHFCTRHIADREKATYALKTALELVPGSEHLQRALLARYRESENWGELAQTLLVATTEATSERRYELAEEVALLVKNRLGASDTGRQVLQGLAEMAGELSGSDALTALKDACKSAEQWELLAQVARQELESEPDPLLAQQLRLELGGAAMQLGELESARTWLETALDKSPHDEVVQKALEDTLAAAEDWQGLVSLYKRLFPITENKELRQQYLEKAAEIEMSVFGNLDSAIELYRQLATLAPGNTAYGSALAEALRKAERNTELTWHLEQQAQKLEGEERAALLRELADVYYDQLQNPDAAIQTLRQLVRSQPEDLESFKRVRSICEREERHETLLRLLSDRSKVVTGDERWALRVEMARLSADKMGLLPPAKTYLDEVLAASPGHADAFALYRDVLARQEDWKGLARILQQQFEAVSDEERRLALGMELASLQLEKLDLKVAAIEVLEKVWEMAPDNNDAGLLLAGVYADLARWDKTASMLAILQEQAENLGEKQQQELVYLSALAHEALLQRTEAIAGFRKALLLDYRVPDARQKLATLLYLDAQYDEARELLVPLLDGDTLTAERRREFKNMLSDIDRKQGRRDRSRDYLEGLLHAAPADKDVLRKLVDLSKEEGDVPGEVKYLERLVEVETDPEARFALQVRLGNALTLLPEREADATRALERAFELKPDSKVVAVSLGDLYARLEQYEDAVRMLREAEQLEVETKRKAAFSLTQGILLADHADLPDKAAEAFTRCLELDATQWEAFTRLEALFVARSDWQGQRELYEAHITRLGSGAPAELRYKLHLNLGKILLEKFGQATEAREHLHEATVVRPTGTEAQEMLAGLVLQTSDNLDEALAACRQLLAASPNDVSALQMLRKTYARMKRYDEAWYVAGVLIYLKAASSKEEAFYRKFSANALKIKPRALSSDQVRKHLVAPEEDWELTEILRILFERMATRLQLPTPKSLGLGRKTTFDDSGSRSFGKLVGTLAKVYGIPTPAAHVRDTSGWIRKEACHPSCMVMSSDLLDVRKGKELRFELGKTLSLFLPQHGMAGVMDRETMRVLLGNLLKLLVSSYPEPPGDPRTNADLRKEMEKSIPAAELGKVRDLVNELRGKGGELSVKRWFIGVDKTAHRAGLLFANDILVATELARSCPVHLSTAPREELVEDLIQYAVSDSFTQLREFLGITVL